MTDTQPPCRPFSPDEFRQVMGSFITGVTVITVTIDGAPHGTTVNSFTAISLDPPIVLIAIRSRTFTAECLKLAGRFGVNVLGHDQQDLSVWFADRARPRGPGAFAKVPYRPGKTGVPLLDGAVAHVECTTTDYLEAGDHVIFLGEVVSLDQVSQAEPLAFHRGKFLRLA